MCHGKAGNGDETPADFWLPNTKRLHQNVASSHDVMSRDMSLDTFHPFSLNNIVIVTFHSSNRRHGNRVYVNYYFVLALSFYE